MKLHRSWILTPEVTTNEYLNFRKHEIEMEDSYFLPDIVSIDGTFFQIASLTSRPEVPDKTPGALFRINCYLQ